MTCEACRTIPPVVFEGYTPRGTFETIAGFNTYITGPTDNSSVGIIGLYDIFGIAPQTLQGADILAAHTGAPVLIPDVFHGHRLSPSAIPPDTPEKHAELNAFMEKVAGIPQGVESLDALLTKARERFASLKKWGAYGLCWGGKVVVLASGQGTGFAATGQAHPDRVSRDDAAGLSIPHIVLASKNEASDEIEAYSKTVATNGHGGYVETYPDMWHGWMGSRADLVNGHSRGEFARGYAELGKFFAKYLQ